MTTTAARSSRRARTDARASRRARRFAKIWRYMDDAVDEQIRRAKEDVLVDLPEHVVEIGSGLGANFAYLAPGTRVLAVEPNTHFHGGLRANAAQRGVEIELHAGDLASRQLADASQEAVISTLVLCSVDDVDAELAEIHRVLRPGGRLLFVEHVAAPVGTAKARYQRLVRRPWRALGDGCDPYNDTVDALARSGLELQSTRLEPLGSGLDPTNLTYWGIARRPSWS